MAVMVVDEIRSNAKTRSTVAATSPHDSVDGSAPSDGAADKERVAAYYYGSSLHGTGECKPCAWFWKPQGCQNGKECIYCHLCPRNAGNKNHKKLRTAIRKELAQVPQQVEPSGNLEAESKARLQQLSGGSDEGGVESLSSPKYITMRAAKPAPDELILGNKKPGDASTQVLNNTRQKAQAEVSAGSESHGTGECKPCAWFWKPGGCKKDTECLYCHLCPEGEHRRKKKEKNAMMKEKIQTPLYLSIRDQQHLADLQTQLLIQQPMMWASGGA